jgi:tetratricopeptide (TPR) repeat protein
MQGQPNQIPRGDFANIIVAQALQHVRDGHPRQAIATLTSRGEAALDNAFVCNLLGLLYSTEGHDEKALDCFDKTLRLGPSTPDLLANRALVLQRLGRLEAAIASYDESLRLLPDDPGTLHGRATALHRAGRFAEALACYDAVLRIRPAHAEALARRGDVLQELGRPIEALGAYENALRSNARDAATLCQHGNVLRSLGRTVEALHSYQAALEVDAANVAAWCGCARCLLDMGAFERALAHCDAALRHVPESFMVHALRANILSAAGQSAAALDAYDRALAIEPQNPMALCNRAAALRDLGRLDEALAACGEVIALAPELPQSWMNRGICLLGLFRLEEALAAFDAALRLRPDYPEALSNRGVVLRELGRFAEALEAFDASLTLRPDFPHALNNKSVLLLLLGDFANGWMSYGGYTGTPDRRRDGACAEWPGVSTLARGLRLLVADEHGLGDCIQFGRYLPQLVAAGADVTVVCRPALQRLLQPLFAGVRVLDRLEGQEPFDYRVGFAGLPRAFLADPQTIPAPVPYLRAEPALAARWSKVLGRDGFKIGIAWQGNPKLDPARAVPLRCFARLAAIPGVRLISLQRFDGIEQLADLPPEIQVETLGDVDGGEDAFVGSAAVMASLDLVIACDTSLAHLAGALGRPVWVALRQVPEWRWLLGRSDTPWYTTMRLFRQSERGDWAGVFERMAEALALVTGATPGAPIRD